jgi:hypothetical protein
MILKSKRKPPKLHSLHRFRVLRDRRNPKILPSK